MLQLLAAPPAASMQRLWPRARGLATRAPLREGLQRRSQGLRAAAKTWRGAMQRRTTNE